MELMTKHDTITGVAFRVLIVDDHPVVRHGLRELISAEPDLQVCNEASGATEAIALMEESTPDLVLVDISLRDGNGIDLIKRIRARHKSVRMLVVSMHDESLYAERAIAAGASGFINKQEATENLAAAIHDVLAGGIYVSPRTAERLQSTRKERRESPQSEISRLSDREIEVFELIGRGMTTREIAARLSLSVKTIETHRMNIKSKLDLDTNVALIRRAVQWTLGSPGETRPAEAADTPTG
jgi:DNA-binding NarL/FixJ family response regulator